MVRSSAADSLIFEEYVPSDLNVTVPLTVSETFTDDDGHCADSGFVPPAMQAFVTFQVPTTFPPQALNAVQSGPCPPLLLEQPHAITHATNPDPIHEACMEKSSN
jgi:hypothetical protein